MQKWRIAENNFHIGNFAFCTINQFSLLFGSHSWAFERVKKLVWLYKERSFGSGNRVLIYRMFFVFSSSLLAFQPKSPNTMAKITCSFAFRLFSSIQLFNLLFSSLPFPFSVHFPFDSLHSAICSSVLSTYHRCGAFKPDYDANKNCVNVIADALLPPLPNVILAHKRRSTTHAPCSFACSFVHFIHVTSFLSMLFDVQEINFDILCQKILWNFTTFLCHSELYAKMFEQELVLWVFCARIVRAHSRSILKWEMTSTTKVSAHFLHCSLLKERKKQKKNERAFYSLGQVANPNEGDEKLFILFLFWHTFFHSFSSVARYTIRCVH